MHPGDQQIEKSVLIEVCHRMGHAGGVRLVEPLGRDVGEMTVLVVPVEVGSVEVTYHHQVQTAVLIEVNQRRTVGASPTFPAQAGGFGGVAKIAATDVA